MENAPHIPLKFDRLTEEEMRETADRMFERYSARRTVRHFSTEPLPMDVVRRCIQAAGTAPSGAHKQPWHFCMVTDPDLKKRIRVAAEKE
ncbi:MAG: nitroreductase family protein, partial [Flavobacteriales bacterium]